VPLHTQHQWRRSTQKRTQNVRNSMKQSLVDQHVMQLTTAKVHHRVHTRTGSYPEPDESSTHFHTLLHPILHTNKAEAPVNAWNTCGGVEI
jgi:hypothetical protein